MSVEFKDYSMQVKGAIGERAIAALYTAAEEIQSQAAANSPVDTGQLRNSWTYVVDEDALVATIGSPLENALWNEFGTGEYALNGDGRKGGWRYQDKDGKWHHTYGKYPRRSLQNAFNTKRNTIPRIFEKEMKTLDNGKSSGSKKEGKAATKKKTSLVDAVKKGIKAGKNPSISIPKPKSGNNAFSRGVKKGNAIAKKITGK